MEHEGRLPSVRDICLESYIKIRIKMCVFGGLTATSVTPLMTRVGLADLAG